jgi:hypothetical protein
VNWLMFNAAITGNAAIAGNEITISSALRDGFSPFSTREIESNVVACVPGDAGDAGVKKGRLVGRWPNQPRFVA